MSDYISREAALGCLYNTLESYYVKRNIMDLPAADVRPVDERVQEPRVMTLEDVKQFVFGTPYIIETNEPDNESRMMYGLYSHQGLKGNFDFAVTDMRKRLFDIDYGKTWRCWTSRPTNEQRKAVEWDE